MEKKKHLNTVGGNVNWCSQYGKQAHEKMLNTDNHQNNANQSHNEILSHFGQNDYHQKEHKQCSQKEYPQITNVGEDT